jgi:hypothetical protein
MNKYFLQRVANNKFFIGFIYFILPACKMQFYNPNAKCLFWYVTHTHTLAHMFTFIHIGLQHNIIFITCRSFTNTILLLHVCVFAKYSIKVILLCVSLILHYFSSL